MSEFNVPYSRASLTTIDITAADLNGANRGQRPDLISSEYTYRVQPGGALYQSNGTILEPATLVVTYKDNVIQANNVTISPTIVVSSSPPNNADGRPDGTIYIQTA